MSMLLDRPQRAVWLGAAILICASPLAIAQTDPAAPSYQSLLARLRQMPAVIEAAAQTEAADARARQAHAIPNPSVGWEAENIKGSGPYRGFAGAETTLSVTQSLELFGQRSARIGAARADAVATSLRGELLRWQAAGRLAQLYSEAEVALRRMDLAIEALRLAEQDEHAVSLLVDAGREARLRGIQARSEAESARADLVQARAVRDAAFARLSALAMLDMPIRSLEGSLLDSVPASHARDAGDARDSLAVRIAQAEVDLTGRRIAVERRRVRPEISAGIGLRHFSETRDDAFTLNLSFSVPLFDRNRDGVRAAHADQRAAEARLTALQREVSAERLAAEAMLSASMVRVDAADQGIETAEEAYRMARIGFDAGRVPQLELSSTRAALIAARNAALDARLARVRAEIALAGLDGRTPFGESR